MQLNTRFNVVIDFVSDNLTFALARQPVVSTLDREVILYQECLARFSDKYGTYSTAVNYIEKLEKFGRISVLDKIVLKQTLCQLELNPTEILACNIHPKTIETRGAALLDLIEERRHLATRLVIEITENCAILQSECVKSWLIDAQKIGVRIALDDFGTGFASPEVLLGMPFDIVKLDRFFVQNMRGSPQQNTLRHLVNFASCVVPVVVIEGIEDEQQLYAASASGATHMQGYLLGRPII